MSQSTKWLIGLVVVAVLVAGHFVVNRPSAPIPTETAIVTEPIKVGFIGPLTGDVSSIGTVNKAAAEIAVEEVNAAGGINGRPLEMIYEDGQCNAKTATNAANKLINMDRVSAIIGGFCSTETAAFGPMAMQNKVVAFSYGSSAPSLSQLGQYFFRSYPSDAFQGKFAAEYAYNTMGARRVAIVYHISEWGTGIKTVFESRFTALGGEVILSEGTPQESRDYRTIMSKVKGQNADLIYMPAYTDGSIVALKQAQELGIKTKFLGADAWSDPKMQREVSGKGDFIFTAPLDVSPEDFRQKVQAKTGGKDVPVGTSNAYDNVKILAKVMQKVGTDTDKIEQELRQTQYDGVSGHIEFDAHGDVTAANYSVSRIQDGTAVKIE
jgi:branched-chain amino acid transport system substrate-binding protein